MNNGKFFAGLALGALVGSALSCFAHSNRGRKLRRDVYDAIQGLPFKPANVRISSLGGAVDDGLDIRQQFVDHGNVTAYLYGLVASSATIAALGAKKVCICI